MQEAAKITCPNPLCQTANPETHRFCQQCRTLVPKRYLWAAGEGIEAYKPGQLIADRYLLKRDRIVLDTKPAMAPDFPADVPPGIVPYLRLFPYQLHVPQVYGLAAQSRGNKGKAMWLLEQVPLSCPEPEVEIEVQVEVLPALIRVWKDASPVRQLNWLWQIAQLWQPFSSEGVASSLLNPALLRVEGSLVRLLELQADRSPPTLAQLGELWQEWVAPANPNIAEFLQHLCQQMIDEQLSGDRLVDELDLALATWGRSQESRYQILTATDTGPSRSRNEDACYPKSSTGNLGRQPQGKTTLSMPLTIVCDGIGGHEGGSIASNLAIDTLQQQLETLLKREGAWEPAALTAELELAVCEANDQISQRNDAEQRQQRQRMGTTVVMALAQAHEIYITHVGDSRAYWITRHGCHQVTLDDDVASREVRLGYALYREALQQYGAGSLVQALGMGSSGNLHPTIQRFVVDEDCIFLLCSDGLSDSDRVEQSWDTELLPVLQGKVDLATAATRLIEIGNVLNGHDNVTVALVYCQVSAKAEPGVASRTWSLSNFAATPTRQRDVATTGLKTQLLQPPRPAPNLLMLLVGIFLLLGLGGLLAYFLIPGIGNWVDSVIPHSTQNSPTLLPEPSPTESANPSSSTALSPGSIVQVKNLTAELVLDPMNSLILLPQPIVQGNLETTVSGQKILPPGSIVQVVRKQAMPGQDVWLQLKVCSIPGTTSTKTLEPIPHQPGVRQPPEKKNSTAAPVSAKAKRDRLLQPGDTGWIQEAKVASFELTNLTLAREQLGKCAPESPSATTPTVTP